jgi:3-hydroxyisobutyrate dehydrogenase-like beta-hydroxyacid dehydrogenase
MKVGFIGLGRMGAAMAANLVKAGHEVTVFNRSHGKSSSLIMLGAHEAADVAGACAAFAAPLGYKDIRLALAAAESLRVPMPLASLLRDRFLRLFAHGGENLDWSAIGGLATLDAGDQTAATSSMSSAG